MKKCSNCKEEKDLTAFNKNKRKSDGLSTECKVCVNSYGKRYRAEHKAEAAIYNKVYIAANKPYIIVQKKQYRDKNKLYAAVRSHEWYLENKELTKGRTRKAKKENPIQYKIYAHKRRAQKAGTSVSNFSDEDIISMYGDRCVYCNGDFEHLDHYIPLSKGGPHILENVRPSCKDCNLVKNNKTPDEWMEFLKAKKAI